jgi:RNA polymerase sigma-70 factor (ECF subfamily)
VKTTAVIGEAALDVAACLERVRQRDEEAARLLLNHLYPLVLKLVRAHLPRRTSEEDLTQIVFMKIFANLNQYSGTVPLEHWVSRIAINACLNQLRVEKVRPELRWSDLSEEESYVLQCLSSTDEDAHPDHHYASKELVEKLLASLSTEDRLIIQLLHIQGHSIEEIKQITGWKGPLIKVRAFRARNKLRSHLAKLLPQEQR